MADSRSHLAAVSLNHLPADLRVPAGLGTVGAAFARSWLPRRLRACPSAGLDGWPQSAQADGPCQSLYPDEAM